MGVMIRVDDFPGTKPDEFWKHNYSNFRRFHEILPKRYLLGVIPKHAKNEDLAMIATLPITVGMHGIEHDERFLNEFREFYTTNEVNIKLQAARRVLGFVVQQDIDIYMPPHNVIDQRTLDALQKTRFRAVTTGPETSKNLSWGKLKQIHSEPPLEYGRSDELLQRGSVEYLQEVSKDRDVVLTLHWPWEFNIGYDHLKKYVRKIENLLIDFEVTRDA